MTNIRRIASPGEIQEQENEKDEKVMGALKAYSTNKIAELYHTSTIIISCKIIFN